MNALAGWNVHTVPQTVTHDMTLRRCSARHFGQRDGTRSPIEVEIRAALAGGEKTVSQIALTSSRRKSLLLRALRRMIERGHVATRDLSKAERGPVRHQRAYSLAGIAG